MHILYFNTHLLMLKALTDHMNSTLHVAYACRFFLIPDINTMKIIIRQVTFSMQLIVKLNQEPFDFL